MTSLNDITEDKSPDSKQQFASTTYNGFYRKKKKGVKNSVDFTLETGNSYRNTKSPESNSKNMAKTMTNFTSTVRNAKNPSIPGSKRSI